MCSAIVGPGREKDDGGRGGIGQQPPQLPDGHRGDRGMWRAEEVVRGEEARQLDGHPISDHRALEEQPCYYWLAC